MINYEFKKGELNKLNNLNQDLKTIFNDYWISDNGCITGNRVLSKGDHLAYTDYRMPAVCNANQVCNLNSKEIFNTIKENKKDIKYLYVPDYDTNIYLKGDNTSVKIGNIAKPGSGLKYGLYFKFINKTIVNQSTIYRIKNDRTVVELSEDDVYNLVNNEYINISENGYRTRITKEVIPGLKKSHTVSLEMWDHPNIKSCFNLLITVYRQYCTSFHTYTCLKV